MVPDHRRRARGGIHRVFLLLERFVLFSFPKKKFDFPQGLLEVVWKIIPNAIPLPNDFYWYNWIVPVVLGGLLGGVMLGLAKKLKFECGGVVAAIKAIHDPGILPFKHFIPMLMISLVTITAGGSAGPEAAVVVMGGSVIHLLDHYLLRQPLRERRILTVCGMTAALATFFGMPLTAAIFVLEIPHHNGLEYYEAISPAVCSSVIASIVKKLITGNPLGGGVQFIPLEGELYFVDLAVAAFMGVLAGVSAFIFVLYMKLLKWITRVTKLKEYPFVLSMIGGILIGGIGAISPSSLFWSENEMQWAVQQGAANYTLPYAIYPGIFECSEPLLSWELACNGLLKLLSIGITVASLWPGGIIFPLIFSGALIGQAWGGLLGFHATVTATCFMAALMAAVLRTPWSAVLIVLLLQGGFTNPTHYLEVFPLMIIAVMTAMIIVYWTRFFGKVQHGRRDLAEVDHNSMEEQKRPRSETSGFMFNAFSPDDDLLNKKDTTINSDTTSLLYADPEMNVF